MEEPELSAVLVGPLAKCVVCVDLSVAQRDSIVLVVGDTSCNGSICYRLHKGVLAASCCGELLAHVNSASVLNTHDEDVTVVEEEVLLVDRNVNFEQISDLFCAFISLEFRFNNLDRLLDGIDAGRSRLIGAHEDVQIKGLEVLNCVNDTRARPGTNCMVGILAFEPGGKCPWVAASNNDPVGLVT